MNEARSTRYQRLRRRAHGAGAVSAGLMLSLVAFTPAAGWLSDLSQRTAAGLSGPPAAAVALTCFVILLLLVWEAATLPAVIYLTLRVDGVYGRSAQNPPTVEDALHAHLQSTLIAAPAALVAAAAVVVAARVLSAGWWALAGLLIALVLAAALRSGPAMLAALADARSLSRPDLAVELRALARRARVPVVRIDEWMVADDAPTSALVTGVGTSRRVLLSSDLVRHWSDAEIAVVVAHELAHHRYGDLWRTLAVDVLVLSTGLLVSDVVMRLATGAIEQVGPNDLAALPLVALVTGVVWFAATPLRRAQSRRHERRADVFALAMTGGADAFGAAIKRLGERHLAEERPSRLTRWLFHSHPSVAERLALADSYRRINQLKVFER